MTITKRWEVIPTEQYSDLFEELSKERQNECKSHALYINGEVTENSDQETDSQSQRWRAIQFTKNIPSEPRTQMFVSSIHSTSNLTIP
ncbi:hypothetical protein AVEN_204808-1 [Araneus ventricosus]|uniref:Uncharacterized protein n=1 Tax=Araneus ventricosus TaxID=182803 RepID=A0A4Y2FUD5_ARAVE|nr:hypothetical protein AVEN_204808-1 [Araneus ventricosus]